MRGRSRGRHPNLAQAFRMWGEEELGWTSDEMPARTQEARMEFGFDIEVDRLSAET